MSDQARWLELVNNASANVKAARLLDADWPAGTIETADAALDAALGGLPPPPPPPPPPPAKVQGFGGTYDASHGYAFDWYPNGENGPHYDYEVLCPVDGTVEKYAITVGASGQIHLQHHIPYTRGLKLLEPPDFLAHYAARADMIAASPMYIAVFTPTQPVTIDGQRVVRVWYGHVQNGFPTGRRQKGDRLALCGNSGIASLPGEASHIHCCASGTGNLTPNGDLPGILAVKLLGRNPRVDYVPGPQQYMTGQWFRGKRR